MIATAVSTLARLLVASLLFSSLAFADSSSGPALFRQTVGPNYADCPDMGHLMHWGHMPIRVALAPPTNGAILTRAERQAILAGFQEWTQATQGLICYRVVSSPTNADLTVTFDPQSYVPGQGAAIGYTSLTFSKVLLRNATMEIALGNTSPDDLQVTAAHEFGHALGIDGHSDNPNDLMYPVTARIMDLDGITHPAARHVVTLRDLNTLKLCYPLLFTAQGDRDSEVMQPDNDTETAPIVSARPRHALRVPAASQHENSHE